MASSLAKFNMAVSATARDLRKKLACSRTSSDEGALSRGHTLFMPSKVPISAEAEEYRDLRWQREESRRVETAYDAERFVERVGFAACLTDSRRPGPSLYVAHSPSLG